MRTRNRLREARDAARRASMALCDVAVALGDQTGKPLPLMAEADRVWTEVIKLARMLAAETQGERTPRTTRWYRKARRLERERDERISRYNEKVEASEKQVREALEGVGKVIQMHRR